jgi:hypothetical protein
MNLSTLIAQNDISKPVIHAHGKILS